MRWLLAVSLLFGGIAAAGCATEDEDSRSADTPRSEAGIAQDGKSNQSDPVCGTRVNPRDASTEVYDGTIWWFDREECRQKFLEDPVAYVGPRLDPVCHMIVETKPAPFKEEYQGKTYFFDSMECWQKFHRDPTAYEGPWIDPVCHARVGTKAKPFAQYARFQAQYGGRTYYFDSMECLQKFQVDPTAFVPVERKPSEAEVK